MNKEEFFKIHNLMDEDLEELSVRFRDALIHYYHRKQGTFYSKCIDKDIWYVASHQGSLVPYIGDDKEYRERIKKEEDEEIIIKNKINEIQEGIISIDALMEKVSNNTLNRELINVIIENNYHLLTCVSRDGRQRIINPIEHKIQFEHNRFSIPNTYTLYEPNFVHTYHIVEIKPIETKTDETKIDEIKIDEIKPIIAIKNVDVIKPIDIKIFNFLYDLEGEDLYVQFNNSGKFIALNSESVVPCTGLYSYAFKFYTKEEDVYVPIKEMKFKGLILQEDLIKKLYNTKLKLAQRSHYIFYLYQGLIIMEKDKESIPNTMNEIINKNSKNTLLVLSRNLVKDVIENEFYLIMYDHASYTNSAKPMLLTIEESAIKHVRIVQRLNKIKYEPNHIYQYNKGMNLSIFDLIYDFKCANELNQLYICSKDTKEYTLIDNNTVLTKSIILNVDFYTKAIDSESFISLEEMTFKGIFLDPTLNEVLSKALNQ